MTPVRLEPASLRSRVKHSTTEPLRSHIVIADYYVKFQSSCATLMSFYLEFYQKQSACAEPESFVRGGPILKTFFFKFDEGRNDPNNTKSGQSSTRQQNAI